MFGFLKKASNVEPIRISSDEALESVLEASDERIVGIFKHSSMCGSSFMARRQVISLAKPGDPPVFEVVVQEARGLSDRISELFALRHASPQLLLVHRRTLVWNGSHGAIQASSIREALQGIGA